ncbi:hypothetical protein JVT61DRAFT_13918 [Boletus reticuloceps]|uniref:Uncharacterized protein n=1 Tax=Boletus reticuloceps TaxID=495285 RepID=A0A8I2YRZ8_9AGAM|nr:hypothetical protein JVT61DRAFT_13918 [Boletus reticuloceps]
MTVLDAPANEIPNVPAEHGLEQTILTNELSQQTPDLNGPPCPICLEEPFHIRYYCPIVLKGPDAIRERLEELKRTNTGDRHLLIKQLEGLLRQSEVTSKPSLDVTPTDDVQLDKVSPPPNASLPRTPNMPSNSYLSEVTVERRDEGSSSDSSDGTSDEEVEPQESSAPQRQNTPDKQPFPSNDDLEASVRGPVSKRKSVHPFISLMLGYDDSHSEVDQAELEEDPDEETSRSRRQLSTRMSHSSDSENGEEEESRSPLPSHSAEDTLNDLGPGVQSSNKSSEKSAENQESNVVMQDSVDPHVLEGQDDDGSEETHVGSEDRMAVDESMGEKGAITGVQEQPSPSVPSATVLQPSDALSDEPQESATTQVDHALDRDGSVLVATEVLKEVEADPIESAEDLEPPVASRSLNADPIEAPSEDIGSFFNSLTQSTPKPGVSKRIKTRSGQVLDDEADGPVLLEQLASEATKEVTPAPVKGKLRRKSSVQELVSIRKSPRFHCLAPATSTPAAVALLNHRSKSGTRTGHGKGVKTPAKQAEERLDAWRSGAKDAAQNMARIAPTPSLVRWEILAEPSSPSAQLDEPSMHIDELMSSSPNPEGNTLVRPNNKEKKVDPARLQRLGRQKVPRGKNACSILRPNLTDPAPAASLNGKESEGETDSEDDEPKVLKRLAKAPVRFRPLSQLATQATLFSPSLSMTTNKSVTNGKAKNHAAAEESSSSSSSSDADEANGSGHIPRGRDAGAALKTKKRKSLLSKF